MDVKPSIAILFATMSGACGGEDPGVAACDASDLVDFEPAKLSIKIDFDKLVIDMGGSICPEAGATVRGVAYGAPTIYYQTGPNIGPLTATNLTDDLLYLAAGEIAWNGSPDVFGDLYSVDGYLEPTSGPELPEAYAGYDTVGPPQALEIYCLPGTDLERGAYDGGTIWEVRRAEVSDPGAWGTDRMVIIEQLLGTIELPAVIEMH